MFSSSTARIVFVALAMAVSGVSAVAQCENGEVYDGHLSPFALPAVDAALTCSAGAIEGSTIEVVQLFTPESVPWNVTKVCYKAMQVGTIQTKTPVSVKFYWDEGGYPSTTAFASKSANVKNITSGEAYWDAINVGNVIITRPRFYIGINFTGPCGKAYFFATSPWATRRVLWRATSTSSWQLFSGASDNVSAVVIRANGGAASFSSAPSNWTCDSSKYNDNKTCDCGCGIWDPDCAANKAGPVSSSCNSTSVCSRSGVCEEPGWTTSITGCALSSFGSGDGCQCGCGGVLDPDCRDSDVAGLRYPKATNCGGVSYCSDSNTCATAWSEATCASQSYGDGSTCQCACGTSVVDPDCLTTNISDCGSNKMCFSGACIDYEWPVAAPSSSSTAASLTASIGQQSSDTTTTSSSNKIAASQSLSTDISDITPVESSVALDSGSHIKCSTGYIGAGDGCDCACGVYDPDCEVQTGSDTKGCPTATDYVCSLQGLCVANLCGNNITETNTEQCDGIKGCNAKCKCKERKGWYATTPVGYGCFTQCGDIIVAGDEECDGGLGCTSNCTCGDGFVAQGGISCLAVAGNTTGNETNTSASSGSEGWICANESYGTGDGCDCACGAWDPDCEVQTGTDTRNCPTIYYVCDRSGKCVAPGCGNGIIETAREECDYPSYVGCKANCKCKPNGYVVSSPIGYGCIGVCGDDKVTGNESCDGGLLCEENCTCTAGTVAYSTPKKWCKGCGNEVQDDNEECDGGDGCSDDCTCSDGWMATTPLTASCIVDPTASSGDEIHAGNSNTVMLIAIPISSAGALAIGAFAVAFAVVRYRRKREAPNTPIDIGQISFVPTEDALAATQFVTALDSTSQLPKAYNSSPMDSNGSLPPPAVIGGLDAPLYPVSPGTERQMAPQFPELALVPISGLSASQKLGSGAKSSTSESVDLSNVVTMLPPSTDQPETAAYDSQMRPQV